MKRHTLLAAAWLCLVAGQAFGQVTTPNVSLVQGPPNPDDRSALVQPANNSSEELEALRAKVDELERRLSQRSNATPTPDAGPSEEVRQLAHRVANLETQMQSLVSEVNNLAGAMIDRQSNAQDLPILSKMRTDYGFRQEMQRVIQGKVIFNNQTGMEQPVLINGNRWRVPPGTSHLMVPYGVVYAQLPWESTKTWDNWRFVGNEQQMTINIGY